MLFRFSFLQYVVCVRGSSKKAEEKHFFRHAGLGGNLGEGETGDGWLGWFLLIPIQNAEKKKTSAF